MQWKSFQDLLPPDSILELAEFWMMAFSQGEIHVLGFRISWRHSNNGDMICIKKNIRIKIKLFLGSKKNILSGCFFFLSLFWEREGRKEGSKQSSNQETKQGRKAARKQASKEARKKGNKEGRREGRKEGRKEGMKLKAVFQDTYTLVERGSPTISTWFNLHSLTTGMLCIAHIYIYTLSTIYIYIYTHTQNPLSTIFHRTQGSTDRYCHSALGGGAAPLFLFWAGSYVDISWVLSTFELAHL